MVRSWERTSQQWTATFQINQQYLISVWFICSVSVLNMLCTIVAIVSWGSKCFGSCLLHIYMWRQVDTIFSFQRSTLYNSQQAQHSLKSYDLKMIENDPLCVTYSKPVLFHFRWWFVLFFDSPVFSAARNASVLASRIHSPYYVAHASFFSEFSLMLIACVYIYTQLLRSLESMHNEHETPQDVPLWKFNASLDTLSAHKKSSKKKNEWRAVDQISINKSQKFQPFSNGINMRRRENSFFVCLHTAYSYYAKYIKTMQSIFEWRCLLPSSFFVFIQCSLFLHLFEANNSHNVFIFVCMS